MDKLTNLMLTTSKNNSVIVNSYDKILKQEELINADGN